MGGRVFKEYFDGNESLRMNREQYDTVKKTIVEFLYWSADYYSRISANDIASYESIYYCFPVNFTDKDSFGDVDVVVNKWFDDVEPLELQLKKYFNECVVVKRNGPIVHFLYDNKYQIDFLLTKTQDMISKAFYLSYSIGMLLGIIARHMGTSLSMEGLRTRHTDILIYCDSNYKIFQYFRLSVDEYNDIKTEEDAFKFIWSCPFATHEVFESSLASCKHRKREVDNKTFKRFFEWLQKQPKKEKSEILYIPTTDHEQMKYLYDVFGCDVMEGVEKKIAWQQYQKNVINQRQTDHYNFAWFVDNIETEVNEIYWKIHNEVDSMVQFGKLFSKFKNKVNILELNREEIKTEIKQFIKDEYRL